MDELQDLKPHPVVHDGSAETDAVAPAARGESLSIWFFCGILTLGYGLVLSVTGFLEWTGFYGRHFELQKTVLMQYQPTLWWGLFLLLFGLFYTVKFRPGKG
jgi:hypothetical protein